MAMNGSRISMASRWVDVLWRDGNPAAALRLEGLWNELAADYSFQLLCAYAMGNFYSAAHSHQLEQVCNKHGRVIPAETFLYAVEYDARAREICLLQQRARALEAEIQHRKQLELACAMPSPTAASPKSMPSHRLKRRNALTAPSPSSSPS